MIIDFALASKRLEQRARLASPVPYCGPCFDAGEGIHDLVPCKRYDGPDSAYCACCGEEYR